MVKCWSQSLALVKQGKMSSLIENKLIKDTALQISVLVVSMWQRNKRLDVAIPCKYFFTFVYTSEHFWHMVVFSIDVSQSFGWILFFFFLFQSGSFDLRHAFQWHLPACIDLLHWMKNKDITSLGMEPLG